jgi:hypothetical protein
MKGGKRPNCGRKKGAASQKTLEKIAVLREYRQRVMRHADNLFNAQYQKAVGSVLIFRVDEEGLGNGKTRRVHTQVTKPDEIKRVLDENQGGAGTVGEHYYFVTDVMPDNKAIDSLLDRTFGKSQQSIEITDETNQKWKQAVQQLIDAETVKNAAEAVTLLKSVGFSPPSEQVEQEVIKEVGTIG